jgi:hypothetical protein
MPEHVPHDAPTGSRFTRSVNIEQDLWEPDSLRGYMVTAGARRALLRIAPARHTAGATRAWTLTGPYGTGKSALALFTATLFASDLVPGNAATWKLVRAGDALLVHQIRPPRKSAPALLPIAITGSREPLHLAILRGLQTALGHLRSKRCARVTKQIGRCLAQASAGKQPSAHAITKLFSDAIHAACSGHAEIGGSS